MEITKEIKTLVMTTDNQEIKVGDMCVLSTVDETLIGSYDGLTKYGALRFIFAIGPGHFNIKPKSIESIYKCDLVIGG